MLSKNKRFASALEVADLRIDQLVSSRPGRVVEADQIAHSLERERFRRIEQRLDFGFGRQVAFQQRLSSQADRLDSGERIARLDPSHLRPFTEHRFHRDMMFVNIVLHVALGDQRRRERLDMPRFKALRLTFAEAFGESSEVAFPFEIGFFTSMPLDPFEESFPQSVDRERLPPGLSLLIGQHIPPLEMEVVSLSLSLSAFDLWLLAFGFRAESSRSANAFQSSAVA